MTDAHAGNEPGASRWQSVATLSAQHQGDPVQPKNASKQSIDTAKRGVMSSKLQGVFLFCSHGLKRGPAKRQLRSGVE